MTNRVTASMDRSWFVIILLKNMFKANLGNDRHWSVLNLNMSEARLDFFANAYYFITGYPMHTGTPLRHLKFNDGNHLIIIYI